MLLILDEYWDSHPEMQQYPIYYGSKIASRSMDVYKKYINMMNDNIQKLMDDRNPFDFKHVETLKSVREYQDHGPCVVMCSPGTMVSARAAALQRQILRPRLGAKGVGAPRADERDVAGAL
jgi:cleavage and polyadenylation specificity factor subunit 3